MMEKCLKQKPIHSDVFHSSFLPRGHFTVSVQSAGYEIGQFRGHITGDKLQQCQYILKPSEAHSHDSTYAITVYGRPTFTEKKIVLTKRKNIPDFPLFLVMLCRQKPKFVVFLKGHRRCLYVQGVRSIMCM